MTDPRSVVHSKTIGRKAAFELAQLLIKAKMVAHPELLDIPARQLKPLVLGLKKAFESRGAAIGDDEADGIADAVQAEIPSARDGEGGMIWTPAAFRQHLARRRRIG